MKIEIHADDYGVSRHATEDLLDCMKAGKLDGISIMPNMSCFLESMEKLNKNWHLCVDREGKKPKIAVHFNLMEGHCVSPVERIPLLTDEKGYFKVSWGSLLLASYNPFGRKALERQIELEFVNQVKRVMKCLPEGCGLRIDSHQHTHMIPVVREAMLQAIKENQLPVTYVRVAKEPMLPFVKCWKLLPSFGIANLVKNVILNCYAVPMRKRLKNMGLPTGLLWGLNMSGYMDIDRIRMIYPQMEKVCDRVEKKDSACEEIEILFHPGVVLPEEINEEYVKKGFVEFHLSEGRSVERHAVDAFSLQ